jgi:dTMP kinase
MMHSNVVKRGQFITLEGIDGAGKSSHLSSIVAWIKAQGINCVETREPGGTELGEQLRQLILHHAMSPLAELFLIFAARAQHVQQVIEPALARGDWVVCDRFIDSTRAYQGAGRGMDAQIIEQLATALTVNQPDLTFIFNVDVSIANNRIGQRTLQTNEATDKFESAPEAFTRAVQQTYQSIAALYPQRCVLIDTNQALSLVKNDVLTTLTAFYIKQYGIGDFSPVVHDV